jgi:hypothetical protein
MEKPPCQEARAIRIGDFGITLHHARIVCYKVT